MKEELRDKVEQMLRQYSEYHDIIVSGENFDEEFIADETNRNQDMINNFINQLDEYVDTKIQQSLNSLMPFFKAII